MADLIQSVVVNPSNGTHHYLGNAAQQKFFVLALTRRAVPYLVLFEDAQMTTIPRHSGGFHPTLGVVSFRKISALWDASVDGVGAPVALTEGVTPPSKDLNMTEVTTYLKQYGDWIKVSDLSEEASIDGILVHAAEALGEYEGQKLHRVMLYALDATTNLWYGDGSAGLVENTVTAGMTLTAVLIRKLVRAAKRNNMARFPDGMYHMLIDPGGEYDLQGQADFFDSAKYNGGIAASGGPNILTGEIGRGWGVRFKVATELLYGTGATTPTTHNFFYGPNGFGMLDMASMAVRKIDPRTNRGIAVYQQPVNRPDKIDPLGQLGFVSCKVAFAGVVFDPNQVMKVMTAVSG